MATFIAEAQRVSATVVVGYVSVDVLVVQGGGSPIVALLLAIVVMVIAAYVIVGVAGSTWAVVLMRLQVHYEYMKDRP